jgi:hypothetical protein
MFNKKEAFVKIFKNRSAIIELEGVSIYTREVERSSRY